jgi:AraC-like DNA-binding protein/quercetin dioxygenase-like cupin family protein
MFMLHSRGIFVFFLFTKFFGVFLTPPVVRDPLFSLFDFTRPWPGPFARHLVVRDGVFHLQDGVSFYASVQPLRRGHPFPIHRHDFLECAMVSGGSIRHTQGETRRTLRPFDVVFISPGEAHRFECSTQGALLTNLGFLPSFLGYNDQMLREFGLLDLCVLLSPFQRTPEPPVRSLAPETAKRILFHAFHAVDRLRYHPRDPQGIGRGLFKIALDLLLEAAAPNVGARQAPYLLDLLAWIQGHYRERVVQSALAARFGLSASSLATHFNRVTGSTLAHYVNRLRIEDAKRLLVTTTWPISRIALEVGYESITHFNDVFKERVRQTPTSYRRRNPSS